tara:strand:- start:10359 stop:10598 length:240 start_codon:yes stop_codon:yes gene_type:complete
MKDKPLLAFGIGGTVILALCCFTPALVVLSVVGLAGIIGKLDVVLLPALVIFIGLTAYTLWRKRQCATGNKCKTQNKES